MKQNKVYPFDQLRKLVLLSTILLTIGLSSCDDILEEKPKSVTAENFYTTVEEIETAVNAIYSPLKNSSIVEFIVRIDTHTDWGYGRGSRAILTNIQGFNSIDEMGSYWENFYNMIRNSNIVIKNSEKNLEIERVIVDKFLAEAKFLRALAYYHLVRNYGALPLRTEENLGERDLEKSQINVIYDFILSDLHFAELHLDGTPRQAGRPTKYAAKALLADVYLTLEDFENSKTKAWEVIQSNQFSLVPISTFEDFQWDLFGPEIITSSEEIFYIKYSRQPGYGNYICWVLNHPSTNYFSYGGAYAHYGLSTNPFFANWNNSDIRKQLWKQVDFGLGSNTLVCNKYIDPGAVSQSDGGNDLPLIRYPEVLLIYAEASCRISNGPTTEGLEALNQVHRRAYGFNPRIPSTVDFKIADYNKDSFCDLVLQERAYEFIFEGKRWYDLKRTGKAEEVIKATKGVTIAEKAYLWPIPSSELNYNLALDYKIDQNPGY